MFNSYNKVSTLELLKRRNKLSSLVAKPFPGKSGAYEAMTAKAEISIINLELRRRGSGSEAPNGYTFKKQESA